MATITLHGTDNSDYCERLIDTTKIKDIKDGKKKLSSFLSKKALQRAIEEGIICSEYGVGTEIYLSDDLSNPIWVLEPKYVVKEALRLTS